MFAVAGESLVDLVEQPEGNYFPAPGGAPYNFARALALQGVDAGYLNPFSSDAFGRLLETTLTDSGARHLGRIVAAPTSLAVVATNARGEASYSFYREGTADRLTDGDDLAARVPAHAFGLHTGGLALVPTDVGHIASVMLAMRAKGVVCTLDVNARPAVVASMGVSPTDYRHAVLSACGLADILKVSDEDLRHLDLPTDGPTAARIFLDAGCALVILTLGDRGAEAIGADFHVREPALPVDVVDSVGAGDCFFAGFIASLVRSGTLTRVAAGHADPVVVQEALAHASACASINLARTGCQPATWAEARAGLLMAN